MSTTESKYKKQTSLDLLKQELTDVDKSFLIHLYKLRCMSVDLAFRFFYSRRRALMPYCEDRLFFMVDNGLITMEQAPGIETEIIFLTKDGVRYVTTCIDSAVSGIIREVWNEKEQRMESVVKSAATLRIKPPLIKHQLALNYFVLEYMEFADKNGIEYEYYDMLFAPKCSAKMMPDGVLVLNNKIVLVEMDTGSERGQVLLRRWESYRVFFARPTPFYDRLPIVILFVLENNSEKLTRKNTFLRSVCNSGLISDLDGQPELYTVRVDEARTLLQKGFDLKKTNYSLLMPTMKYLTQKCGMKVYDANFTKEAGAPSFSYYAALVKEDTEAVVALDGRRVEYLLDIWDDGRLSVLHKILYMRRIGQMLQNSPVGRSIPYLVAVPSVMVVASLMKQADIDKLSSVYFITPDRIAKNLPFYETIFTIDEDMNIKHFTDYSLITPVFEKKYDPSHPDR